MQTLMPTIRPTALVPIFGGFTLGSRLWDVAGRRPSLDLRFADNKSLVDAVTGASLVTFTRASSGTYVDSAGVLQTAATDVPRFGHNPVTLESLGLLVEEQRTNLLVRSEEFETTWTPTNVTISANAITAPNGTLTADKLVETVDNGVHAVTQGTVTPGLAYVFSVYAKAGERTRMQLSGMGAEGQGFFTDYNLSTGVFSSAPSGSQMIAVGDGWYRCTLVITASAIGGPIIRIRDASGSNNYTGDGTSGIFLWGAQLEAGSGPPTSYIPTTTAAVTRSADVVSITGSAFSSWYRQDEGSLFVSASAPQPSSGNRRIAFATDGTSNNRVGILFNSANTPQFLLSASGTITASISSSVTATGFVQSAAGYALDNFAYAASGLLAGTDTSGAVPSTVDRLSIGSSDGTDRINGTIRRLTYWNQRLANSTLQQITQ